MQNFNSKFKTFSFLLALLPFAFCLLPLQQAHAQEVSLGISPTVLQIDAKPPASINSPITIENNGEEPVTLQILFRAFTASSKENGHVQYYPSKDPRSYPSIFDKIQITEKGHPKESILLAPHEKKSLVMHIGIPKNQPGDDYYFSVIFVSQDKAKKAEKTASQTPVGIATNVLLSLEPKGPAMGEIVEFSTPFFFEHGPVPFTLRLKNTSDHMLVPRGEILIKNMFNRTIGRVTLLPVNVLSKTTRSIPDILQSPDATLSAELTNYLLTTQNQKPAAIWPEQFLLGPYSAQLTISLSEQGPIFRRNVYFFALPLSVFIGIIMVIIIITYVVIRIRRRMKRVK